MTNEELDATCGDFAGLEFSKWKHEEECDWSFTDSPSVDNCRCKNLRGVYACFSTDWAAAGRLMDALKSRGIFPLIRPVQDGYIVTIFEPFPSQGGATEFPRALCLAVADLSNELEKDRVKGERAFAAAALAEASGKEAGR